MGVKFFDHIGGKKMFACLKCKTHLTNRRELISTRFTGATGRAFLFKRAVNIKTSKIHDRLMLTGRHFVRDISCKKCNAKVGWMYEYATDGSQRYKEGCVILERALVSELHGIDEIDDDAANAVELTDSAAN